MNHRKRLRRLRKARLGALALVTGITGSSSSVLSARPLAHASADSIPRIRSAPWSRDTLSGQSGKLWMKLITSSHTGGIGVLTRLFGDSAAKFPGVYTTTDSTAGAFTFVNLVPFTAKQRGMIGTYRIGSWPAEQRRVVSESYANPPGFIQVTPQNQDTRVSEHFRLRDFLTKDQTTVWPKYLVLREGLLDKLELVIGALQRKGLDVSRMSVMSGFRTPQYNQKGVGAGGRAQDSRHQYGDAADVYVDSDGDGRMDDLNRDGRVNTGDARFLAQVVESIEQEHPDLTGGVGIYPATSTHGPFVHVDVRGTKARW